MNYFSIKIGFKGKTVILQFVKLIHTMENLRNLVMLFLLSFLTACGDKEIGNLPVYQTMDDLKGKKVGVITGTFQEALLERNIQKWKC